MHHRALVIIALCCWAAQALAYDSTSPRATDLSGTWKLNAAASDDAQRMLDERLEKERRQRAQWRRHEDSMRPPGVPPSLETSQEQAAPARRRPWQQRRYDNFRKMLAIGDTLTIRQNGTSVEIVSPLEARRVEAGSRTQVSMPEGQLADSRVGWDGEWFVIERAVRKGPRVVEKYRIVKKTGQLEYRMAWGGETELAGMKVTRYFERETGGATPDPAALPMR